MPKATHGISLSAGGVSIQETITRDGDHPNSYEVALAAAKAGTLSTRTDNDTGIITSNGHGYLDTDTVDVYWEGGRRLDMDVTAVATNTISINAGTGDNLPTASTPVTVCKQVTINAAIDGDAIQIVGIELKYLDRTADDVGRLLFEDGSGDDIASLEFEANTPRIWDVAGGATNPFAGDPIVVCRASHSNSDAAATLKIVSLEDSTP